MSTYINFESNENGCLLIIKVNVAIYLTKKKSIKLSHNCLTNKMQGQKMKCVYKSTTYHKKPFYLLEKRSFENQNYHVKLHKLIHTKTEH